MKNILVVGEVYSDNLGDGVICDVVDKCFNKEYSTKFFDLSGRTDYKKEEANKTFNYLQSEKAFLKTKVKHILYKLGIKKTGNNLTNIIERTNLAFEKIVTEGNIDVILFAGGQMFLDSFVNQIHYVCNYAEVNKIPVFFNACGYGKLSEANKTILKEIFQFKCIKYISVRDNKDKFLELTDKSVHDVNDTALIVNQHFEVVKKKTNEIGIGIMVTPLFSTYKQIAYWKKVINLLDAKGVKFKVFTNGSIVDQQFAKHVIEKCGLNSDELLLARPTTPDELVKNISRFKKILSMRLHSLIIAYSLSIPALSISWDSKVKAFYKKANMEHYCYQMFDRPDLIVAKLFTNIDFVDSSKTSIDEDIEKNITSIKKIINKK